MGRRSPRRRLREPGRWPSTAPRPAPHSPELGQGSAGGGGGGGRGCQEVRVGWALAQEERRPRLCGGQRRRFEVWATSAPPPPISVVSRSLRSPGRWGGRRFCRGAMCLQRICGVSASLVAGDAPGAWEPDLTPQRPAPASTGSAFGLRWSPRRREGRRGRCQGGQPPRWLPGSDLVSGCLVRVCGRRSKGCWL